MGNAPQACSRRLPTKLFIASIPPTTQGNLQQLARGEDSEPTPADIVTRARGTIFCSHAFSAPTSR
jgi:hypothetical protein